MKKALRAFGLDEKQTGVPWPDLAAKRPVWKSLVCPDSFYNGATRLQPWHEPGNRRRIVPYQYADVDLLENQQRTFNSMSCTTAQGKLYSPKHGYAKCAQENRRSGLTSTRINSDRALLGGGSMSGTRTVRYRTVGRTGGCSMFRFHKTFYLNQYTNSFCPRIIIIE